MAVTPLTEGEFQASVAKVFGAGAMKSYPKNRNDRLTFLGAAVLSLNDETSFSESEINAALGTWLKTMEALDVLDHVTLRRYLVDERLLAREKNGTRYLVNKAGFKERFEAGIIACDVQEIAGKAEAERRARKVAWQKQQA